MMQALIMLGTDVSVLLPSALLLLIPLLLLLLRLLLLTADLTVSLICFEIPAVAAVAAAAAARVDC